MYTETLGQCLKQDLFQNLTKLDLTVNFVAEVTSLESLRVNSQLEELYMVGEL